MKHRRLIDAFDLRFTQDDVPFAIPHLEEDIPLYLDPFLLWASDDETYKALHETLVRFLEHLGELAVNGRREAARQLLLRCEEPKEFGLGYARESKRGSFMGPATAERVVDLYVDTPQLYEERLDHVEELGLFVPGVAEDRISDMAACVLREFFTRFTESQARAFEIPTKRFRTPDLFDVDALQWRPGIVAELPYHPGHDTPLLFAPLDLLRHLHWINYGDYYRSYFARHVAPAKRSQRSLPKPEVLAHNRSNYAHVKRYVAEKERSADLAKPDPLFEPLKLSSIETKVKTLAQLATGTAQAGRFEAIVDDVLASALYPELEFADSQVRTESGGHIRDLLFYNDGKIPFTEMLRREYGARQVVFECKNVAALETGHVNQLYRYLDGDFGQFGVLVTRAEPPRAVRRNLVDLHSSKRVAIVCLVDDDLRLMLRMLEARRRPIEVLKKKFVEFQRLLPN
jgi:hypothetical protein